MGLLARLLALGRHEGGNVALLFGLLLPVFVLAAAFAVDEAALYHERRLTQSSVDLAAIAAVANPGGAEAVARTVLADTGRGEGALVVETGHYAADPARAAQDRFVPDALPTNAVRISYEHEGQLHFARPFMAPPRIGAMAVASTSPEIAFSIGSRLARLEGGIANQILSRLLGASVALDAVSYRGLANARVGILPLLDALAIELGIDAGTFNDVLAASADHGQIARALSGLLTGTEASAAQVLALRTGGNGSVPLGRLFALGDLGGLALGMGERPALSAEVGALEVLGAAAMLGTGNRQVEITAPVEVPGLLSLSTRLAIGDPPQGSAWYRIGPAGGVVRTAQVRMRFVARLLGSPVLLGAQVSVPLFLEIASGEARAIDATCPTGPGHRGGAVIAAEPGLARLVLGTVPDEAFGNFASPANPPAATLLHVPIVLSITAEAEARVGNGTPAPLVFSSADIAAGTVRSARTADFTQSLTATLLGSLNPTIRPLGLGIGLSPVSLIRSTLIGLLTPLGREVDRVLLEVLDVLGLSLGEVDVIVHDVRCTTPVLVH
ncbi:hypothetical protein EMQ25_13570 [Arsenicitalea aurantiaca]|uniref:DUF2134 domain-containing protein n=1 Tax=Arsenicitalea aurantiaca TaxID=1783274 RepID=A0A433X8F3_9HYPH|nr:TadG family pilus assembly protein [Arsenicitalea aurantiaca]RUT30334.1 hypothetical protein EMQ25_13570 [Arsenicitalea aurantiaca]